MSAGEAVNDEGQCFKDSTKKCCSMYIRVASIILLILGIVMGAYGYFAIGGQTFQSPKLGAKTYGFTINANTALSGILIVGAIFAVATAIIGIVLSLESCHNFCFAGLFMFFTFIGAILALAFGAMVLGGDVTKQVTAQLCSGAKELTGVYSTAVDQTMCSDVADACKCDGGNSQPWTNAKANSAAQWTNSGRTKDFDFTGSTKAWYPNCYNAVKTTQTSGNNAGLAKAKRFFEQGGFEFLQSFEKQFNCAGVCQAPLFYMTKELSAGIPTQSCDQAFISSVAGSVGAGAVGIVTGIFMLTLFIGAVPLCTKESDKNDAMGGA